MDGHSGHSLQQMIVWTKQPGYWMNLTHVIFLFAKSCSTLGFKIYFKGCPFPIPGAMGNFAPVSRNFDAMLIRTQLYLWSQSASPMIGKFVVRMNACQIAFTLAGRRGFIFSYVCFHYRIYLHFITHCSSVCWLYGLTLLASLVCAVPAIRRSSLWTILMNSGSCTRQHLWKDDSTR